MNPDQPEPVRRLHMREGLGEALVEQGRKRPNLVVLAPDVSRTTRAVRFKEAFPERFVCTGISEMNTLGMAAGLAATGWLPVVTGQALFIGGKAWEPLRNSIAYPRLNVKVVGTHAGINVGPDGVSHQAVEDLALLRAIPGMVVFVPADANQVKCLLEVALEYEGPVYIRLEREPVPVLTDLERPTPIGGSLTLREGTDVTLVAIGGMVEVALKAAQRLAGGGVGARVINAYSVKPLDEDMLRRAAQETGALVVCEDHNIHGGLSDAIAALLARSKPTPVMAVAVQDVFAESGRSDELRDKHHLTAKDVVAAAERAIAMRLELRGEAG